MASMNGSVSSQLESSIPIHQTFDAAQPQPPPIPQQIVLTALPNSRYGCPRCPRTFSNLKKAEYHVQHDRHTYACPRQGCKWSFPLPKDLRRHVGRHNPNPTRLRCPIPGCSTGRGDGAFSRPDLLKRHVEKFH